MGLTSPSIGMRLASLLLLVVLGASTSVAAETTTRFSGLLVGQHFHRIPGSSEDGPVLVPYHFVRSLNSELVGALQWWTGGRTRCEADGASDCAGRPDEDWAAFDRWAEYHARPGEKRLLLTFAGTPRWASARPSENNPYCDGCGFTAEPHPRFMAGYRRMVASTVARYRDRLFGVECWNEPYFDDAGRPRPSSYFTGTPTALAEVCKAIHAAAKAVDPAIPVFCPQSPSPAGMAQVLAARTSAGEPIHRFCDVVGAHTYNAVGVDDRGRDLGNVSMVEAVTTMRGILGRMKLDKPIAITEWGFDQDFRDARAVPFHKMTSAERGELIYRTLATLRGLDVMLIALYSYDGEHLGIWQGLDPVTKRPRYDAVQARRVADAVRDFGPPSRD